MRLAGAVLALGLGLILLPRLGDFAQITSTLVAWPWQFDYTEGVNLNTSVRLAGGINIYAPNGTSQFHAAPYPPLFYLLTAPFVWPLGPALVPGRGLSLLATLVIAGLLVYSVRRATGRWLAAGLAGALWLALSPVIVWAAQYKQDMLALAFELAGLAWVMTVSTGRRLAGAAVLFALGFYTKQSALDAAAASTVWLLARDWRTGLRFAGGLAVLIGLPFLLLDRLLGGLVEHLIGNHALPWSVRRFGRTLNRLVAEYWPLLLAGGGVALGVAGSILRGGLRLRTEAGRQATIGTPLGLAALYLGSTALTTVTRIGYEGANYNHLLDLLLALCLLLGLAGGLLETQLAARVPRPTWAGAGALIAGLLLVPAQFVSFTDPHTWYRGAWPSASVDALMRGLSQQVADAPGDIYSEDAYLILSNGRQVQYDDPSTFVPLANLGKWDDRVLNQSLLDRRFGLILLQHGAVRWTATGQAALDAGYSLRYSDLIDTYVPRAVPDGPQYPLDCTLTQDDQTVALTGYSLGPGVAWRGVRPGEVLRATLYWRTQQSLLHPFASFVHLDNAAGERVAGQDNAATGAALPPPAWLPGQVVTDTAAIPLPADLPPGRYRIVTGLYRQDGGAIRAFTPQCQPTSLHYGDAVAPGWVEVKAP